MWGIFWMSGGGWMFFMGEWGWWVSGDTFWVVGGEWTFFMGEW